ncbi:MAG TPA: hypothetical protein VEQ38_03840 [Verrucomicrobiae bacterium]|nr:hypothetical protein [Verrucomicrobiae bacterium]
MDDKGKTILIESDSMPGDFYSVDLQSLSCTCPYFVKKFVNAPLDDPHRLCKHLTQAFSRTGIPPFLERYALDIEWFGKHNAAYSDNKSIKTIKNRALQSDEVRTTSVSKKKKYCYATAVARDKKISAVIPLDGGPVSYAINNSHAQYNTVTQESAVPMGYRNLEEAIVSWIVDEYNKAKNDSAPAAVKPEIDFKPIQAELPEGSVKTISVQKKNGLVELGNVIDDFEDAEHFYLRGEVGREFIEAIIRKNHRVIIYKINASRVYSYDLSPTTEQTSVGDFTITASADLSHDFPRAYKFMQKAVLRWLRDEHDRITALLMR